MASLLSFTESNHSYWLADVTGKRRRAVSVSSLRKSLHTFDGERYFLGLAASVVADDWEHFNELAPTSRRAAVLAAAEGRAAYARDFGTAVHHYCQQLWTGEPVNLGDEYVGHVQSAADWWQRESCTLEAAELLVWDDSADDLCPLAGRLDLIVKHPKWGRGLLDLKTWLGSSSGQPRPAEWAFQLAAYGNMSWAVVDNEDVPFDYPDWLGVLHIGPSGAVLWRMPPADRAHAEQQVEYARALRALTKPTMIQQGGDSE